MVAPNDKCDKKNDDDASCLGIKSHIEAPNNPCELDTTWADQEVTIFNHRLHPVKAKICCESDNNCSEYNSSGCDMEFEKTVGPADLGQKNATEESFELKKIDGSGHDNDVILTGVEYKLDSSYEEGPEVSLEVDVV